MARYNTAPQTLTVNGAIEFGYAFTGGIISLTGTTGYTVTLVSPVFFPGSKQTFYNATDGMITIETVAGQIKGNGVALGTDIQIPQNSTYTLTSDGADYVLTSALAGTTTFELPVNFNNLLNADGKVELNPADNNVEIKPTGTGLVDISPQSSVSIQPGAQATIRPVGNLTLGSSTGLAPITKNEDRTIVIELRLFFCTSSPMWLNLNMSPNVEVKKVSKLPNISLAVLSK